MNQYKVQVVWWKEFPSFLKSECCIPQAIASRWNFIFSQIFFQIIDFYTNFLLCIIFPEAHLEQSMPPTMTLKYLYHLPWLWNTKLIFCSNSSITVGTKVVLKMLQKFWLFISEGKGRQIPWTYACLLWNKKKEGSLTTFRETLQNCSLERFLHACSGANPTGADSEGRILSTAISFNQAYIESFCNPKHTYLAPLGFGSMCGIYMQSI